MLYPKISGPFKRHADGEHKNKLIIGDWAKPEFGQLAFTNWHWTEKVDGTNIRVMWDGYNLCFGGRTNNAQLHKDLVDRLFELFREELFEQNFGESEVTLFGEGYGAGIQKGGGAYSKTKDFILFDVFCGGLWLEPDSVAKIGAALGVKVVPSFGTMSLWDAIDTVSASTFESRWPGVKSEGLVGTVANGLLNRRGERIQMKVKKVDFP